MGDYVPAGFESWAAFIAWRDRTRHDQGVPVELVDESVFALWADRLTA